MAGPPQVFPIHSKRGTSAEAVEIIAQDTPTRTPTEKSADFNLQTFSDLGTIFSHVAVGYNKEFEHVTNNN